MTPSEFAAKWAGSQRTERAAAQEHFIDLCRMLGLPTPNDVDPAGAAYGWPADITDDDLLERLLALYLDRGAHPDREHRL